MNRTILLGILFVGIAALMMFPIMNAMAVSTGTGTVIFINKSDKHGKIVREDDGTNDVYQFQIPQGLADPNNAPVEGDTVTFDIDPDQAKVARNVEKKVTLAIISFTASPDTISAGESTTLSWQTTGADTASIDQGVGSVSVPDGSVAVAPLSTTTFTLTIVSSTGNVTLDVTLTVS